MCVALTLEYICNCVCNIHIRVGVYVCVCVISCECNFAKDINSFNYA